jgi:signal transduction histidine kinase
MNITRAVRERLPSVPLAIKVPLIVATLMIAVSIAVTFQVFARLVETQDRTLADLTEAYLDGLSSSLLPHVQRDDNWEVFDSLERSRVLYQGMRVTTVVVVRPDRTILASTDPARFATEAVAPEALGVPNDTGGVSQLSLNLAPRTWLTRALAFQGRIIGTIHVEVDLTHLRAERRKVLSVLVASNLALTLVFALLGWWLVRRMLSPLRVLARHMELGTEGALTPIALDQHDKPGGEFDRLFSRFNAMAQAMEERELLKARTAEEERLASLGRLSSIVAHEINNPLGGLLNAVDTLKAHGHRPSVREDAVGLLERGLNNIRDVVGMTLAIYRPDRNPHPLRRKDIDDLRLLVEGAALRCHVKLIWRNRLQDRSCIPSGPLRQILLNLALNAIQATPVSGTVTVEAMHVDDTLQLTVEDGGSGLPEPIRQMLEGGRPPLVPGSGNGLGVWVIARLVADLSGRIAVPRNGADGTRIEIVIEDTQSAEIKHVA